VQNIFSKINEKWKTAYPICVTTIQDVRLLTFNLIYLYCRAPKKLENILVILLILTHYYKLHETCMRFSVQTAKIDQNHNWRGGICSFL